MSRITRIIEDEQEFLDVARGKIREDLRRYLSKGQIHVHRRGEGKTVQIPVEWIEIPTLRYGFPPDVMIGQGEGDIGGDLGPVEPGDEKGKDSDSGGQGHGDRGIIVEFPEDEFSRMFQEILELPRIKPKGDRSVFEEREKYSTIARLGPHSMIHLRRSFLRAIQHNIATGDFRPPEKNKILVYPKDRRYRSYEKVREPKNNAVIFYLRDNSGSMGMPERVVVNRIVDFCEFWLSWNYDKLDSVFIIHDDRASEVPRAAFFREGWYGGTTCSSALKKMHEITEERYPASKWNIYGVYLSDGMNWESDNLVFVEMLRDKILPVVNQFNYGQLQLQRPWWDAYQGSAANVFSYPGSIGKLIEEHFRSVENVVQAVIGSDKEEVVIDAIRKFFGKGN